MNKISKIAFSILVTILLIWQLPWMYSFTFGNHSQGAIRFMLFSPVTHEFSYPSRNDKNKLCGEDLAGNTYTANELDSILPLFYCRQLAERDAFPDSIMGQKITLREAQKGRFIFRSFPDEVNGPMTPLYMLLESQPERLDFEFPKDMFRCTKTGLEFLVMETNQVETKKSAVFTQALLSQDCVFPIIHLHSIPNVRKSYDNGFMLIDNAHQLFHMKMVKGKAMCRRIKLPKNIQANQAFVTEFEAKKYYGFMMDTNHTMYVIDRPSYEVHRIDIPSFDPTEQEILIIGNPFIWTVRIEDKHGATFYGIDGKDYHQYKNKVYTYEDHNFTGLHFTSSQDGYVYPRWN